MAEEIIDVGFENILFTLTRLGAAFRWSGTPGHMAYPDRPKYDGLAIDRIVDIRATLTRFRDLFSTDVLNKVDEDFRAAAAGVSLPYGASWVESGSILQEISGYLETEYQLLIRQGKWYSPSAYLISPKSGPAKIVDAPATDVVAPRRKRSTEKGEGRVKLIAALTKHHDYAQESCLNLEPIGNNALARLAGVDQATASVFFRQEFKGHAKYKAICADAAQLAAALKLLNGEFAPHVLFGRSPSDERERDEE